MMKRIKTLVLLILTVLLVAGVLCGCAVQTGEQPGISSLPHITIGSDTYPPFVYLDNNRSEEHTLNSSHRCTSRMPSSA